MCNPVQSIVDKIVEYIVGKVFQPVFQPVERHVGFVFHYKRNLKDLEDKMKSLQEQRSIVEGKVDEANHRGEEINNNVSGWLKHVDETRQEVVKFMDEKKENMMCFNFSCPDFISRYRLSKQTEKKVVRVKDLTAKGGKISRVAHPREAPPELEFPYSRDYEDFQSRYEVFTGIVKALKDPNVNIIGVYGTGGVGKTTMVTKIGELVKKDGTFDEVVIAVVSQDANVQKIQEQLAERLKLQPGGEIEVGGRATQLWNRLDNGKKNLIILDDVWQRREELDLNKIGIPITDRNKSCKVVLTSRNQEVWKDMKDHKDFKIEFLSEREAWTLFKKKVGNNVDSPDHPLHDIAWEVCKECQGLPVAVTALGGALKDKKMYAWQDAFHKLKNSMLKDIAGINTKVFTSLRWSYDWLDSNDAKSCFLLCCLFPKDVNIPIDDLVRYYMTGRIFHQGRKPATLEEALYRVCTVVNTLKGCCLLLDGRSEHYVKMHDVVRDVAISIAKEEKSFVEHGFRDWLDKAAYEHCTVISLRPNDVREFPEELVCPELHTLRLDCTNNEFQLQVPDRFFSGTKNLVVLDLKEVPMLPLPASLAKLAKLQMLCLNNCKLGDIDVLKDLKDHLEILSLRGSNIKVLPTEIGELKHLRLLDMEDCKQLGMISKGVVSKLIRLEELYMPWTFDKWEGTSTDRKISIVSLDELMSLTQLTTLHITIRDPALLPKDGFFFENLVRFRISVGDNYYYYGDTDGVLKLQNVHLANTLEILLGRNRLYPSKSFSHLGELSITNCTLKYLFSRSCARGLVQLQELNITSCTVMEGVIGTEGEKDEDNVINFSGLKKLSLEDLPNLISFYPKKEKTTRSSSGSSSARAQTVLFNDKATFPALERLEIHSVPDITEIWNKQILPTLETATESSFSQLSKMTIRGCGKLVNVVGGCLKIEAIEMEKQKGKVVDDYVTHFPKLTTLELKKLPNLESFCNSSVRCEGQVPLFDHQSAFPALETLEIDSVPEITEIWNKQILPTLETTTESSFSQLLVMNIGGCDKLMNVVGGCPKIEATEMEKQKGKVDDEYVTRFPKLTTLGLYDLPNLESFCNSSVRCEGQVPLFDHQVAFSALERLDIQTLPNITDIWDKKIRPAHQRFCPQQHLSVEDCGKLVYVVPSNMLPQLCNLESLTLDSCPMAEVIVDLEKKEEGTQEAANNTIVPFPKLSFMSLKRLRKIKGFCAFRSEEQHLFNTQVAFPKLEELVVDTFGERALTDASELSLKRMEFYERDEVSTVISSHLFRRLRFMDLLDVTSCRRAREVFHFDGLEVGEGQVCVGQLTQVRKLYLNDLPQLTCLWNKDPHRLLGLQSLEYLTIVNCPLLANLFTVSVAKALVGLKVFYLRSCSTMEAVIATDEGHVDAIDDDREIVFPKLEWLILKDLSNLKSFCTSNHNFNFPSLKRLVLKRCPKVQAFTSGSVLPQIFLSTRGNECLMIEDLNKHLGQQHLKGDQETILDGEMNGDEDRFSHYWNLQKY